MKQVRALGLAFAIACASPPDAATPEASEARDPASRLEPEVLVAGDVRATFEPTRTRLLAGAHSLSLDVRAIGRGDVRRPLEPAPAAELGDEVQRVLEPAVVEWWRALPSGLEHGVNLTRREPGTGPLAIEIAVEGATPRSVSSTGAELVTGGRAVARYTELAVVDAEGESVPARMEIEDARIVLWVDDRDARYPLVVDPLFATTEATLVAPAPATGDYLGYSVSLTADATRAIVGAPYDDTTAGTDAGSAHVYVRGASGWTREATLTAFDGAAGDLFGFAVAISGDGAWAVVGVLRDDTAAGVDTGSARVFARSGTTWTEATTLPASGAAASDQMGYAVAISADGTRAIVGAALDDTPGGANAGSVRVYSRSTTTWTQEAQLFAPGGAANDFFGAAVSLTDDATRALVSAYWDDNAGGTDAGSAYVFRRSGTTWSLEATLLAVPAAASGYFGGSVAIARDGTRAIVGATGSETAHVFVRSTTSWTHEVTLSAGAWNYGTAVGLDATATHAIVGADLDFSDAGIDAGSARVYSRAGTTWTEEVELISSTVPGGGAGDHFGAAAALSADGTRALVGAPYRGTRRGAAFVFVLRPPNDGASCTSASECTSGICVDGVCCTSACGGGAVDCEACSVAAGGSIDGLCTPLTAAAASTVVCRASAGICDREETCVEGSRLCPPNSFLSAATECRASAGACDPRETCTGSSATCPADARLAFGTTCRAAAGVCDEAEYCDGVGVDCPPDVLLTSFTVCRPSTGACDPEERCDGADPSCPTDARVPAGTTCRAAAGPCDAPEACTATSGECPPDLLALAGTPCRAAAGDCDLEEACTGASAACPADAFVGAGTPCRSAAGPCDVVEACTGSAASCPPDGFVAAGTECRGAVGPCDAPEACEGTGPSCPSDALRAAGETCRAAAGPCDVAETCSGAESACPSDALAAAGTECRAAAGACDVAEACTGGDAACPPDASAAEGTSCADGDACNGEERCEAGSCVAGAAPDCDDGDDCTADACDTSSGCSHTPIDGCCADASDCDDDDPCTVDLCEASACAHAPEPTCADGGWIDAGPGDAGTSDGGAPDGGAIEVSAGCGCAVPARTSHAPIVLLTILLVTLLRRSRRR